MANTRVPELTDRLPPTPVTPMMRKKVVQRAKRENVSLSEIQRRALSLFLATTDTKHVINDTDCGRNEKSA